MCGLVCGLVGGTESMLKNYSAAVAAVVVVLGLPIKIAPEFRDNFH